MKRYSIVLMSLFVLSFNIFAAERPDCQVSRASTSERVNLKLSVDGTYGAVLGEHDFDAFIDGNSINMIITKPADASGDRETVSTSQIKPSQKQGVVNMYLSNAKEQFLLICRVIK